MDCISLKKIKMTEYLKVEKINYRKSINTDTDGKLFGMLKPNKLYLINDGVANVLAYRTEDTSLPLQILAIPDQVILNFDKIISVNDKIEEAKNQIISKIKANNSNSTISALDLIKTVAVAQKPELISELKGD